MPATHEKPRVVIQRFKSVTSEEAIEVLRNLQELSPPNGTETWLPYLVRMQQTGLITLEERSSIQQILLDQGTVTKIAKIEIPNP